MQDCDDNYPNNAHTHQNNTYILHTWKDSNVLRSKSPDESEIVVLKTEVRPLKKNLQAAGKILENYGSITSSGITNFLQKLKEEAQGRFGFCCHQERSTKRR